MAGQDEPSAGSWRVESVGEVLARLGLGPMAEPGRPTVVAIDGRGGAGKSVLAQRLAAAVTGSAVVSTDDIAWHHSFFGWADLLREHVLEPLHRGESVSYRPQAWAEREREGAVTVPAGLRAVFVEGTGASRRELHPWLDAAVWVQIDPAEASRRLIDRDGTSVEIEQFKEDWAQEEEPFLRDQQPWAHATVIVAGNPSMEYDRHTELLTAISADGRDPG